MRPYWYFPCAFMATALVICGSACVPAQGDNAPRADVALPSWKVGDRWTVETATRPIPSRSVLGADVPELVKTQWKFEVTAAEKVGGKDSLRVEILSLEKGPQPKTVFWVDQQTFALRQVQMQIPTPEGFRTITESYEVSDQQSVPVITPLSALPIDLPAFVKPGAKAGGAKSFQFEAVPGPAGQKAIGGITFSYKVEQSTSIAEPGRAKSLLHLPYSKDIATKPVVQVQLKSPQRKIEQMWRSDLPWPVYTDNGSTQSKLLDYTPAK